MFHTKMILQCNRMISKNILIITKNIVEYNMASVLFVTFYVEYSYWLGKCLHDVNGLDLLLVRVTIMQYIPKCSIHLPIKLKMCTPLYDIHLEKIIKRISRKLWLALRTYISITFIPLMLVYIYTYVLGILRIYR